MEMSIKAESIDIKSEDEENSNTPLLSSDVVPFEESDCKDEVEDGCKHDNGSEVKTKQEHNVLYKCDKCIYETESEICFTAHCARHENDLEAYKCESCEYETENEKLFQRHLLRHKDSSKVQMYRCNECDYETKAMADVKETSCRLCLKYITDEGFEVIDNSIRDMLYFLLLKLKFDDEGKEVICNVCRRKLNAASGFKSTCRNTDKAIIPYVDSEKVLQLDLTEVYMQEKKSEVVCSQKICRLCMHPVESEFRCIREVELEAIEKLAPEVIINIVKDPVVCRPCLDSLCTHNSFLKDCLEVEEKVKSIFDSSATGNQIVTSPLGLFVKTENLDKKFYINEMEMPIKVESIDIKSEDEEISDMPLQSSDIVPFEERVCKDEEDGSKRENGSEMKTKLQRKVLCKFSKCIYETGSEFHFTTNDSEVYKCESCEYETENEKLLQRHLLRHKDPPQIKIYRCKDCHYETKYRSYFKRHQLKHKDPSQVPLYSCKNCDYETKYKNGMIRHNLKHKDPSQVQMYRCKNCDFETKYKAMADVKGTLCRLCFKYITDEGFEVVDNSIRDMLDVLLLKLKFDNESKEVICKVCRRKLNAASEFKSTCLDTDKAIIPYVDSEKVLQLDLREVYMQEKKNELVDISCSQKICRLCMQPIESEFKCIYEVELEAIEKLAPEMNLNIIKDPVVCKSCFDSLGTHNSFLKDCLEVERKIESTFDSSATENQIDMSSLDLLVKTEHLDREFDVNEMEMSIKVESIDIKSEDEERSNMPLQSSNMVPFEESDCKDEGGDGCKHENGSEVKTEQERKVLYKCDKCIYETESEIHFTIHCATHENDSEAYKCESCQYKTKNKTLLQRHLLRHKDPSQNMNIIKDPVVCKRCLGSLCTHTSFLTDCLEVEEIIKSTFDSSATESQIDTSSLDLIVKTEKSDKEFDTNEMEMSIKAEIIDIKSEDEERSNMPPQSSDIIPFEDSVCKDEEEDGYKHESGSEMTTKQERKLFYKCDKCIYETLNEVRFTAHCFRHKNDSELCKCENEKLLQRHLLKHKDPSEFRKEQVHMDQSEFEEPAQ
ncbi:uncharacterized protein LOC108913769 [Anoplophora glabripennis]|uniref:uncharacterized protein LOC108913769 n=1 Tax=Anoplophora glabripennis TaxID=217634 RepID=UPI000C75FF88|nr:uncharacterized protein LOC108913769 [Anoplophora glabripennis]